MNKRMNKWNRFLAMLLLVVMCCTLIPQQTNAAEDYRTWDQADERWGSIKLGNSGDTMEKSGCLVTSVTKLIIQAGLKDSDEFNPAILVNWLNKNGGFTDGGALYWDKPAQFIDGLSYYGKKLENSTYEIAEYTDDIIKWIKEGYHIILRVKNNSHFVLVDEALTLAYGEIYIMDSQPYNQNADIRLADRYSNFNRAEAYTGGITPELKPEEEPEETPGEQPEEVPEETPDEQPGEEPEETPGEQPEEVPDDIERIPFIDIPENIWYRESVQFVYNKAVMTGKQEDIFAPEDNLNRGEFATIVHRMAGNPVVEFESVFPDVTDNFWYTDGIIWAYQNNIVTGHGDGTFRPSDNITREQIALMMYRFAVYMEYDVGIEGKLDSFKDAASVSTYANTAVKWAVGSGIVTGKNEGTMLDPQGQATRAECATIIMRFMQNYE